MPATYEPIATTTLGSLTATISFTSIAASWTDLKIIVSATNEAATPLAARFNSDTATNYSNIRVYGTGSSAGSGRDTSISRLNFGGVFDMSSTIPFFYEIDIFSYAGSTFKTILSSTSADLNTTAGGVCRDVGLWRSTSAITSITLLANDLSSRFTSGTTATLYGIKAA